MRLNFVESIVLKRADRLSGESRLKESGDGARRVAGNTGISYVTGIRSQLEMKAAHLHVSFVSHEEWRER